MQIVEVFMDRRQKLRDAGYLPACELAEVPQMMPKKVTLNGLDLLICRDEQGVFAVDEICPHKHKSMAFGVVFNGTITCPHHQYVFDLDSGRCRRRRCAPVMTYPVEVVEGTVFVQPG